MFCQNCGEKLPDTAKFCGYCGETIEQAQAPTSEVLVSVEPKEAVSQKKFPVRALVLVISLLAVGIGYVGFFSPAEQAEVGVTSPPEIIQGDDDTQEEHPLPATQSDVVVASSPTATDAPEEDTVLPGQVGDVLLNPEVVFRDDFDGLDGQRWWFSDEGVDTSASSDELVLVGTQDPMMTFLVLSVPLQIGDAVVLRFYFEGEPPIVEMQLETGEWQTDTYKRFGFAQWAPQDFYADVWDGKINKGVNDLSGSLSFVENERYYLLLAVDTDNEFYFRLWSEGSVQFIEYREIFDESWKNKDWSFHVKLGGGKLYIDSFEKLQFAGYR